MKTAAASTPSYHSAWNLAHGRLAEADAKRRAWLDAKLKAESKGRQESVTRTPEQKAQIRDAMRRWRAKQPKLPPPGPCSVCGKPKRSRRGTKCRGCEDHDICPCGRVKHRKARLCASCRGWEG